MKKILFNKFKLIAVCVIIITLVCCAVVSQDEAHLDSCHDEHCSTCAIIHIAQTMIQLTFAICIYAVQMFLIQYFLAKAQKKESAILLKSLVFQKVQFNE